MYYSQYPSILIKLNHWISSNLQKIGKLNKIKVVYKQENLPW